MERTCKSTQRADVLSEGRELPMRGLGKFFLGGLLGAILGFLISPRRCQVVRDAWQSGEGSHGGSDIVGHPRLTSEPAPEPALEPEPESAPSIPPEMAAEDSVRADLKARIEETRRRIQQELDQPFSTDSVGEAGEEEASGVEPAGKPSAPAASVVDEPPASAKTEVEGESASFDREAMRTQIEETRNRLKSKVFDAMMAGEEALLSHSGEEEEGDETPERSGKAGVDEVGALLDEEVDERIEDQLRESDDV